MPSEAPIELEISRTYTRAEIQEILGGESYGVFPMKQNEIVAGCFSREQNPMAPEEVYPPAGLSNVSRVMLALMQRQVLPIFLSDSEEAYEFVGYYEPKQFLRTPDEIAQARANAGRNNVSGILYFEQAA